MAMVSTFLSQSLFKDFRIAAGRSGLHNDVHSTGYFEWEEDIDIVKNFPRGEFVVTTLYAAKDDAAFANRCLKLLINNHVAAIAIKDLYYDDLSDDIKNYADQHHVPILFFSNLYIDDIIVAIRNELSDNLHTTLSNSIFQALIFDRNQNALEKESLLRKINSFFYSDTVLAAYISKKSDTTAISPAAMSDYNKIMEELRDVIPLQLNDTAFVHSFAAYKRGMFLISTCNTVNDAVVEAFQDEMRSKFFTQEIFDGYQVGIGNPIHGFADISSLLLEAIFANTSCTLEEDRFVKFADIGIDALLFAHCYTPYYDKYYGEILDALSSTESGSSALIDTLLHYVYYGGNIEKTANAMFQHKNTIRYRINKISTLLHIDNDIKLNSTLYLFSRLHYGRKYLQVFYAE